MNANSDVTWVWTFKGLDPIMYYEIQLQEYFEKNLPKEIAG